MERVYKISIRQRDGKFIAYRTYSPMVFCQGVTQEEAIADLQSSLCCGVELVDDPYGSWGA